MDRATNGKKPDAFLSYAHLDDQVSDGYVSWLRGKLQDQVNAEIGKGNFCIFQDTDRLRAGEHWASVLNEALAGARFLIPILTPSYFASQPCLFELASFRGYESAHGRKDLIIPIYFRDAPDHWTDPDNPHAALLRERQVFDWRRLRHRHRNDPEVLEQIERLAQDIKAALSRTGALVRETAISCANTAAPKGIATLQREVTELRAALDRARTEAAGAREKPRATEGARSKSDEPVQDRRAEIVAPQAAKSYGTAAAVRFAPWLLATLVVAGASATITYSVVAGRETAGLMQGTGQVREPEAHLAQQASALAAATARIRELEMQLAQSRMSQASVAAAGNAPPLRAEEAPVRVATPTPPSSKASQGRPADGVPPTHLVEAPSDSRVALLARERTWVQVQSAARDYVRTLTLRPGERLALPNRADLALWTGNPDGIEILLDGRSLGPAGAADTVARDLTLSPKSPGTAGVRRTSSSPRALRSNILASVLRRASTAVGSTWAG